MIEGRDWLEAVIRQLRKVSFRCSYQNPRSSGEQALRFKLVEFGDLGPVAVRGTAPQITPIDKSPDPRGFGRDGGAFAAGEMDSLLVTELVQAIVGTG